jgi:transcription initiation factor IIE alpha subunit
MILKIKTSEMYFTLDEPKITYAWYLDSDKGNDKLLTFIKDIIQKVGDETIKINEKNSGTFNK